MLQNFTTLTELSLGSGFRFNGTMLHQLSTTTSLRALSIAIERNGTKSANLQPLGQSLQSLQELTLRCCLDDIVTFILACHLPLLDALTLQVEDLDNPQSFGARFALICQHAGLPKSLTSIGCKFTSMKVHRQETLLSYLDPLLSFAKMEYCNLIFDRTVPSVCDEDLVRLGDAWSNLKRLDIRKTWSGNTPDTQHPTVVGLMELARRCPILRYVHLATIDASILPQVDAPTSRLGHPLRELLFQHVYNVTSSERRCAAAEVLDLAFPILDIALSKAECRRLVAHPDIDSQWKRIVLLVWALQFRRYQAEDRLRSTCFGNGAWLAAFRNWETTPSRNIADLDKAVSDTYSEDGEPYWDSDGSSPQYWSDTESEWMDSSRESDG